MRKCIFVLMAAVMLTLLSIQAVSAASDDNVPTLFHNDEAWYKDEVAPALLKDGIFHVPSDFIAMFDYIRFTMARDGENLLLVNEKTGEYISILYSSRAACINGKVVEDVSIFRENGYYYLDADLICTHLGLSVEYSRGETLAERSVRIYDSERMTDFDELLASYHKTEVLPEAEGDTPETAPSETEKEPTEDMPDDALPSVGRIYLICPASESADAVLSRSIADKLGFEYSLAVPSDISVEGLRKLDFRFAACLLASSLKAANSLNSIFQNVFYRKSHIVVSMGDDEENTALAEAGYAVLKPDYVISKNTDAQVVFDKMMERVNTGHSVVVFLGDVWQSETLMLLLEPLDPTRYSIGKIDGTN